MAVFVTGLGGPAWTPDCDAGLGAGLPAALEVFVAVVRLAADFVAGPVLAFDPRLAGAAAFLAGVALPFRPSSLGFSQPSRSYLLAM